MLPLVTAALTFAAEYAASEGFTSAPELGPWVDVGLVAWGVSAALGMAALVAWALAARWRGRVVLLVGGLVLLVATAWMLWSSLADDSSTASLGLLFAPVYGWLVVGATAVGLGVVAVAGRRGRVVSP